VDPYSQSGYTTQATAQQGYNGYGQNSGYAAHTTQASTPASSTYASHHGAEYDQSQYQGYKWVDLLAKTTLYSCINLLLIVQRAMPSRIRAISTAKTIASSMDRLQLITMQLAKRITVNRALVTMNVLMLVMVRNRFQCYIYTLRTCIIHI